MEFQPSLILIFLSFSLLFSQSTSQSRTLERTTKQQIIAAIPPGSSTSAEPFLTSPSGNYAASFLRTETLPGGGGFGNDFCYIQVKDTSTSESVWESECTPVSSANTCTLVFSDNGLAIFDGSTALWDNSAESADNNPLEALEMVDEGDMRLRDNVGELAWKASEDPRANQRCGEVGSAGLAPAMPPFAEPIGGRNVAFGKQDAGASQTFGFSNSPFDSGSMKTMGCWFGMVWVLLITWLAYSSFCYLREFLL